MQDLKLQIKGKSAFRPNLFCLVLPGCCLTIFAHHLDCRLLYMPFRDQLI